MSRNIVVIDSSARIEQSVSRALTQELAALLQARDGTATLLRRDLGAEPVSTLQPGVTEVIRTKPDQLDPATRPRAALSETLIAELQAADTVIIGAPMYNWGVSANLKAWIDQVVRIGFTFTYGAAGPEPLLKDKRCVVIITRGGVYSAPERAALDFQLPYLRHVLGVIGLTPRFVICEGTLGKPEAVEAALAKARAELSAVAEDFA